MGLIKPPTSDPSLDVFDAGVGMLTQNGVFAGHVATTRSWFWSPVHPLRKQWWVWYIVVWADGTRERSTEDYPSQFLAVNEMKSGYLEVFSRDTSRTGRYEFAWLPAHRAAAPLIDLGITPQDF